MSEFLPVVWLMAWRPMHWLLNMLSFMLALTVWGGWRLFREFNFWRHQRRNLPWLQWSTQRARLGQPPTPVGKNDRQSAGPERPPTPLGKNDATG